MRKILIPAVVAGLFIAACGDDTGTGAAGGGTNGGGGEGATGGSGGTPSTGGQGGDITQGGMGGEGGGTVGACGDGAIDTGEICDDGNTADGDGCDASCVIEPGFGCDGEPSVCASTCGDGALASDEECDDGNTANQDGCSSTCAEESGWTCDGDPSVCTTTCGDGLIGAGDEACDDGNTANGDGCDDTCAVENGWSCMDEPSVCMTGCGDGIIAGTEECDDSNMTDGDGCSAACAEEAGYNCTGEPSVCALSGSCADPIIVTGSGFVFAVADQAPYGDDLDFEDPTCATDSSAASGKPDIVFSVDLNAGQTLHVAESGDADVLMHVITGSCASATPCAASFDGFGSSEITPGLVYASPIDQTVLVVVDNYDTLATGDNLDLLFEIATCGDGAIGTGEACDDGDTASGDGCSSTCQIETGYQCSGEPSVCTLLPGLTCSNPILASDGFVYTGSNIAAYGDDLNFTDASCQDVLGAMNASPEMVFQIDLVAGQRLNVADFGTLDVVFQVLQPTCGTGLTCVGKYDDDSGGGEVNGLTFLAPTTGTYFVVVESYSNTPSSTSTFDIRFNIATCGDGVVEFGEPCDDHNTVANDGCSASCAVEAGYTCSGSPSVCTGLPAANCANPIIVNSNTFVYAGTNINQFLDTENYNAGTGCVDVSTTPPSGYDIVFRADLTTGQTVRVRELGGLDAVMHILQAPLCGAGVTCAASTDGSETTGIAYTATSNGPVYIVVESYGNPAANTTYDIRIDITQCGNGIVEGTEVCDDGNTTSGDGCNNTCSTIEAGFACDPGGCFSTAACAAGDAACFLGACPGGSVVTASAPGLPQQVLPDNTPATGITLNIPVTASPTATIRKMIVKFESTMTFDGDLNVYLTRPGGTEREVFTAVGGGGDNFVNTLIRDGVPTLISSGSAPFTGVFRPELAFSAYTGQLANGTWVARVADSGSGDIATLNTLSLAFCLNP